MAKPSALIARYDGEAYSANIVTLVAKVATMHGDFGR